MLPISSSRMKPRGICKESGNDAPQNWIWITYTNRGMEEMRPHPPYVLCYEAHPRLPWATLKPSPERVQPTIPSARCLPWHHRGPTLHNGC